MTNLKRRIIMFNGPPRSGKDTAAQIAHETCDGAGISSVIIATAAPLKNSVHTAFGLNVPTNFFEECKELPNPLLFGTIPRQAYKDASEEHFKVKYGQDFFGRVLVNSINEQPGDVVIISDCGFTAEVGNVAYHFGSENLKLVRLHRPDCDFKNDTRSYVTHDASDMDVENDGSIQDFGRVIHKIVKEFIS